MQSINCEEHASTEKITKYTVLYGYSHTRSKAILELTEEIEGYIKKGWQPQGGVSIMVEGEGSLKQYTVCQAMVKIEKTGEFL